MKLTAYLDIIARPGGEVTLHDVMSFLVQQLHHASRHGKIALAFPNMGKKPGLGDFVRVFAEDIETLNRVSDFLANNPRVDEFAIVRRPKPVPAGVTEYECFSYFRLSHGLSEDRRIRLGERADLLQRINAKCRDNRRAGLDGLPFVTLYSSTTKSQFRLHVQRSPCAYSEGEPNGYGLSRKSQVLAIPVFESTTPP
jgi:CRISPR-associated endoribonuclease Cas6/Csy4 subtype I-F